MVALEDVSPIIFGGGALNDVQYGEDPDAEVIEALKEAFSVGINAFDTSAYYGKSEEILGRALEKLRPEHPRNSYFITTKAGRWENNTFDYSSASILRSVNRSLIRLCTDYIDLLLIHDIEFQSEEDILDALELAFQLKDEGKVRNVGFSGYPVEFLVKIAQLSKEHYFPVDAVLSYCNLTIQNSRLMQYEKAFHDAGVRRVFNASPLSMSLLRSAKTLSWHPASEKLKEKAAEIATTLQKEGIELADIAEQYSFRHWRGPTVVGFRNANEVKAAYNNYLVSRNNPNPELEKRIIHAFADHKDEIWQSGLPENQPSFAEQQQKLHQNGTSAH